MVYYDSTLAPFLSFTSRRGQTKTEFADCDLRLREGLEFKVSGFIKKWKEAVSLLMGQ